MIKNRTHRTEKYFPEWQVKKNDEKLLTFSHRAKDGD